MLLTFHNPDGSSLTATALEVTTELLKRAQMEHTNRVFLPTKLTPFTDEQLLTQLEILSAAQEQKPVILPSRGTTLSCTKCGALNAQTYYLKRSHGHYAVLCFQNGNGCWERSSHANCSYVDQYASQCMDLAEWTVAYGSDQLKERQVCSMHIPAVLSDVAEHRIYPLQD